MNYEQHPHHEPKTDADRERGYVEGTWKERQRFLCCTCPYDSFDEGVIVNHVFTRHMGGAAIPVPETHAAEALIFDSRGEPVSEIPNHPKMGEDQRASVETLHRLFPNMKRKGRN